MTKRIPDDNLSRKEMIAEIIIRLKKMRDGDVDYIFDLVRDVSLGVYN